jgi:hypothetical protein
MDEIDSYDKETQLKLLIKEIDIITTNFITLSSEWYDIRINKINEYYHIDWNNTLDILSNKVSGGHMFQKVIDIQTMITIIMDEWSRKSTFSLSIYKIILDDIYTVWNYYRNVVHSTQESMEWEDDNDDADNEDDDDEKYMNDITEQISNL